MWTIELKDFNRHGLLSYLMCEFSVWVFIRSNLKPARHVLSCKPNILALRRWGQEDQMFKTSLDYIESSRSAWAFKTLSQKEKKESEVYSSVPFSQRSRAWGWYHRHKGALPDPAKQKHSILPAAHCDCSCHSLTKEIHLTSLLVP